MKPGPKPGPRPTPGTRPRTSPGPRPRPTPGPGPEPKPKPKKGIFSGLVLWVALASVLTLASVGGYIAYELLGAKGHMEEACDFVREGAFINDVKAELEKRGFSYTTHDRPSLKYVIVTTERGFGRYYCYIEHFRNRVILSEIVFAK